MKKSKLLDESKNILDNIIGEDVANDIISNMFPEKITGYKKGKILTVGELKSLPRGSVIHLYYKDDDGSLRNDDFVVFCGYKGNDELCTMDGYTMPVNNHTSDEKIYKFNNSGWTFTVSEAIIN